MSGHAQYAPSSGERVVLCTASFKACKGEANPTNEFAAEGSVAHHIGETVLRGGISPSLFHGQPYLYPDDVRGGFDPKEPKFRFVVDDEMVACIKGYSSYCMNIMQTRNNPRMFVERRVDISRYTPIKKQFGTSDCIIVSERMLDVIDLKYGKRKVVKAKRNIQGILYALGAYEAMRKEFPDIEYVRIHIYQPRVNNICSWKISVTKLLEWGAYILERFTEAHEGGVFTPGEVQCEHCLFQAKCKAYRDWWDAKMIDSTDDLDSQVEDGELTIEEIVDLYRLKSLHEKRFKAMHAYLFGKLNAKEEIPGLRLADGKGSRFWLRPRAAEKKLLALGVPKSAIYTSPVLISPAQAEKLVQREEKKALARLIGKKPGNPRIVDENSHHVDYEDSLTQAFDVIDG